MQSEPDVSEFNSLASKSFQLLLPRIVGEDLEFANGQLRSGSFGILEPQGQAVPAGNIDLMILPALAVDKSGNRLGKGKGFYDRALKKFEGKSAAVIFETELLESVPCEAHDMRVSTVVTPLRYLTFS